MSWYKSEHVEIGSWVVKILRLRSKLATGLAGHEISTRATVRKLPSIGPRER